MRIMDILKFRNEEESTLWKQVIVSTSPVSRDGIYLADTAVLAFRARMTGSLLAGDPQDEKDPHDPYDLVRSLT